MDTLKVGVIGCGMMGEEHIRTWAEIQGARVCGIAEIIPERREQARAKYSCEVFSSGREMLASRFFDIVVVATDAPDHFQNVMAAIKSGAHVICEKPLALDLEQARQMVVAAREKGVRLAVHHQTPFTTAAIRAKEMVENGEIGTLRQIVAHGKGRPAPYDLMEIGGHLLHLMRHFVGGQAVKVSGDVVKDGRAMEHSDMRPISELWPTGRQMGVGAGDYLSGCYNFIGGVQGFIVLYECETWSDDWMFLELFGTKGRICVWDRLLFNPTPFDTLDEILSPKWREIELGEPRDRKEALYTVAMRRFAEDFLEAVKSGREPLVTGEIELEVLRMCLWIYDSHLRGKPFWFTLAEHPFLK